MSYEITTNSNWQSQLRETDSSRGRNHNIGRWRKQLYKEKSDSRCVRPRGERRKSNSYVLPPTHALLPCRWCHLYILNKKTRGGLRWSLQHTLPPPSIYPCVPAGTDPGVVVFTPTLNTCHPPLHSPSHPSVHWRYSSLLMEHNTSTRAALLTSTKALSRQHSKGRSTH